MPVDCHSCIHRREVPGSCHSSCAHPEAQSQNQMLEIAALIGRGGLPDLVACARMGVTLEPHGVVNGWASFPFNFDPTWLKSCAKREAK